MTWTNWSGSVSCEPAAQLFPESEGELIELVQRTREDGGRIRVVGTGHSCTPLVATGGRLVSLDRMSGVVRAELEERRAWVRTGTKLHDLGEPLHELGFAASPAFGSSTARATFASSRRISPRCCGPPGSR